MNVQLTIEVRFHNFNIENRNVITTKKEEFEIKCCTNLFDLFSIYLKS